MLTYPSLTPVSPLLSLRQYYLFPINTNCQVTVSLFVAILKKLKMA